MRRVAFVPCVEGMPRRITPSTFTAAAFDTEMPETGGEPVPMPAGPPAPLVPTVPIPPDPQPPQDPPVNTPDPNYPVTGTGINVGAGS